MELHFDLREFHESVLMSGAIPLAVLEDVVDGWIVTRRAVARAP